ncbi:hypothetical protein H2200_007651 [Cladophialophora chaetospira]|uniref:Uncharacterized protein n=1 Tax=Cladophialophora chaetospira TaxID=386627 RepID=A0AA39CGT1_9EURO|nr:hypothetical protein H2200_007651 [Cladophialophora chaetospira]
MEKTLRGLERDRRAEVRNAKAVEKKKESLRGGTLGPKRPELPEQLITAEHYHQLLEQHPLVSASGQTLAAGLDIGATHLSMAFGPLPYKSGKKILGTADLAKFLVEHRFKGEWYIPAKVAIIPSQYKASLDGPHECEMVFGVDVELGQKNNEIKPENVVDNLKTAFDPGYSVCIEDPNFKNLDPLLQKFKKQHTAFCEKVQQNHNGKVTIRNELTNSKFELRINDIDDVIQAWLNFIWRAAQMELASFLGLNLYDPGKKDDGSMKEIKKIFAKETLVATSVPTIWTKADQDRFQAILGRAGFPPSTVIQSEAVAASTYHFNQSDLLRLHAEGTEDFASVDVGGYTLDGAGERIIRRFGRSEVVQTVPARSAFDGSLKIMTILEEVVTTKAGKELGSFVNSLRMGKATFFDRLGRAFDTAGHKFNNDKDWLEVNFPYMEAKVDPSKFKIPLNLQDLIKFDASNVYFHRHLAKEVFDKWLESVVDFIVCLHADYRKACPDSNPLVKMFGRGSCPPYVVKRVRERLAHVAALIQVELAEDMKQPSVAQGNFISLTRSEHISDMEARTSYGIRHDISTDAISSVGPAYPEADQQRNASGNFLLDRVLFLVEKGDNLSEPDAPLIVEGTKVFRIEHGQNESRYPVIWKIDLVVSGNDDAIGKYHYRPFQNASDAGQLVQVLSVDMKIFEADCRMEAIRMNEFLSYLRCEFRARVCLDKLPLRLVISVPRHGKFVKPVTPDWTESWEDCKSIEMPLPHLCAHATTKGLRDAQIEAGWPVQPEVPEVDFAQMDLEDYEQRDYRAGV